MIHNSFTDGTEDQNRNLADLRWKLSDRYNSGYSSPEEELRVYRTALAMAIDTLVYNNDTRDSKIGPGVVLPGWIYSEDRKWDWHRYLTRLTMDAQRREEEH
jgi:hypothetical protein